MSALFGSASVISSYETIRDEKPFFFWKAERLSWQGAVFTFDEQASSGTFADFQRHPFDQLASYCQYQ